VGPVGNNKESNFGCWILLTKLVFTVGGKNLATAL